MVLDAPVLQLNRGWVPVDVITVAQAIEKIYTGRARVIEVENFSLHDFDSWAELAALKDKPALHTATLAIRVPEVIVLTNYCDTPGKYLAFSRRNIFRRDKQTCQFCGARPGSHELTIDHVTPKSRGGKSTWVNCVLACVACNRKKADKMPHEVGLKLRKQPVRPTWSPQLVIGKVRNVPISWERFVSDAYWSVPLIED